MNRKAEKIINTTIKLFLRNGIKKITMDEIAENSNVSKVTIYKYFIDKDTLYYEISKHIFSQYIVKLENIITSDEFLINKLYNFLAVLSDFTNNGEFDLCKELTKYNNDIEALHEQYMQIYKSSLLMLIDRGIENGLIKDNLSRNLIYYYIDMGIVYYQQSTEYRNKMLGDSSFQQQYMLFFINNIFVDGAKILSAKDVIE